MIGVSAWQVLLVLLIAVGFFGLVVAALIKYVFGLGKPKGNSN